MCYSIILGLSLIFTKHTLFPFFLCTFYLLLLFQLLLSPTYFPYFTLHPHSFNPFFKSIFLFLMSSFLSFCYFLYSSFHLVMHPLSLLSFSLSSFSFHSSFFPLCFLCLPFFPFPSPLYSLFLTLLLSFIDLSFFNYHPILILLLSYSVILSLP